MPADAVDLIVHASVTYNGFYVETPMHSLLLVAGIVLPLVIGSRPPLATAGLNVWTRTGPEGGIINALAIAPGGSIVFAGTTGAGVFKTTNAGASWSAVNVGLGVLDSHTTVAALEIDPTSPSTIYAGTGKGAFKSTDGGATWYEANAGIPPADIPGGQIPTSVRDFALHASQPNVIYAAGHGGPFKSIDAGATWTAVRNGLPFPGILFVVVDPVDPMTVYTSDGRLFRSTDGGLNWSQLNADESFFASTLAINPVAPTILYAGGAGTSTMAKSVDGGVTWTTIANGLPNTGVLTVVIDPITPDTLYAGTDDGVFKTIDGGQNWSAYNTGLTTPRVAELAIDSVNPATLYAGTGGGIFKTTNAGGTWVPVNQGINASSVRRLVAAGDGIIYAATGLGVFSSIDVASGWNARNIGLSDTDVLALAVAPVAPNILFAGTRRGGVFHTADGGTSWSPRNAGLPTAAVQDVAINPANPGIVYAAVPGHGLFVTTDGGENWVVSNSGLNTLNVQAVAVDPARPWIVYVGTGRVPVFGLGALHRSTDGGQSWTKLTAFEAAGFYLLGPSWQAMAIDPAAPDTVYVASPVGLFKTTDGGTTAGLIAHQLVTALASGPAGVLYAGTFGGVVKSTDGGVTGTVVGSGFPPVRVTAVLIDPAVPGRIYAATEDAGVFEFVPPPVLHLTVNTPVLRPGEPLRLALQVDNAGLALTGDVFLVVLLPPAAGPGLGCPNGDPAGFVADSYTRLLLTCLSASPNTYPPLFRGVTIPGSLPETTFPGFLVGTAPPGVPSGRYVVLVAVTRPDAFADGAVDEGDVIALASAEFDVP